MWRRYAEPGARFEHLSGKPSVRRKSAEHVFVTMTRPILRIPVSSAFGTLQEDTPNTFALQRHGTLGWVRV